MNLKYYVKDKLLFVIIQINMAHLLTFIFHLIFSFFSTCEMTDF